MIQGQIEPELEADGTRRRTLRLAIEAGVGLRELGQTAVPAQLLNLSSLGFMAETRADIPAGSRVWLTLPGVGRVNALVVWARSGRIGGEFADPLDPLQVFQAVGENGR